MAQVVKLKRTAVQGKIPTTSSLELGELAINTYDGRIFFEKDNGTPSIQSVVVTDAVITGSINLTGAVTASYFKGDGSNLTNLPNADVSQVATVTASFDNQSNISVTHNFDSRNVIISVYDTSYSQIIPSSITLTDNNTADIILSSAQSGFAVVAKGGHIVSGSLVQEVTEVSTVTASFDNQSNISVTHNFESKNIIISVYDSNDSQIIPSSVTLTNLNTATIILSSAQSGYVVVAKGGHLVTATGTISYNNLTDIPSGILSGSGGGTIPAGTISGSSQLTSSFDSRYVLSGSITQTTWDNIASKPNGIVSGSEQVVGILSSLNLQTGSYATTGSNTFVGTQTHSGSIIPAIDNTYDLGSLEHQWRDIFVSSGSLYVDGTKILGSTGNELQITTDVGQSIKILEAGSDNIILQSADGDIQLKSSGGGNLLLDPTTGLIDVRGTFQIQDGNKVTSSGGNAIQFGNDLGITGSITTSGNINGITLSTFSSSLDNRILTEKSRIDAILSAADADKDTFVEIVSLINSVDTTNDNSFASFYTSSVNRLTNIESSTGSYETKGSGIVSGSSQITFNGISSIPTLVSGSSQITFNGISSLPTLISGSSQITFNGISSLPTLISGSSQLSGIGNSQLTNSSITIAGTSTALGSSISLATITNGSGIVSGSSQITMASTTGFGTYINQAVLTSSNPTFAGVKGSSYFDAQANSGFRIRNSADSGNTGGWTRRGLWEGNSNYDPSLWAETGYGIYVYTNGSADIRSFWNTSGHFLPGATTTYNLGSSSNRWNATYVNGLDSSGDVTAGAVSTSTNNVGLRINYGNDSGGYGKIRFYENTSNYNTIHSFSNAWGTNFASQSRGAINIEGYNGVTMGPWNNPDFSITENQGNAVIKNNLTIGGTFTENSSIRYKKNVETIENGLDKVLQMRGVTYDKKTTGVTEIGLIAEEVYDVLPELVLKNEEGEINSVSYGRVVGVLIEAIKEQQKQIEELKALINK